jgi:hypothetical protein
MISFRRLIPAAMISCLLLMQSSLSAGAGAHNKAMTAWLFVEVETTVYPTGVEPGGDTPSERRWYMSNVIAQPENVPTYSLVKKTLVPYFSTTVMDPAEKRGLTIDFYEQDVRLNGESSIASYATKAEAEEARTKAIEYRKEQSGNIYSFEIDLTSPKGQETSKPKVIYLDKNQPHYEKGK